MAGFFVAFFLSTFRRLPKRSFAIIIPVEKEVLTMNQYITGAMIRSLREKQHLTQAELAEKLFVSDKTISKWENGKGYPDFSLLEPIARVFGISVAELLAGKTVENINVSANMLRSKFYVCPVCGNVLHSMGEAAIHCHGVLLTLPSPKKRMNGINFSSKAWKMNTSCALSTI